MSAVQLKRVAGSDRFLRILQKRCFGLKFIRLCCSVDKLPEKKRASATEPRGEKSRLTAVFAEELAPVTLEEAMRTESAFLNACALTKWYNVCSCSEVGGRRRRIEGRWLTCRGGLTKR